MPTRNVSLPESLDLFVDQAVKSGNYDNASEVVRAGLRLLWQEEKENLAKLEVLKGLIAEGMAGSTEEAGVVFERLRQRIKDRAAQEEGHIPCERSA